MTPADIDVVRTWRLPVRMTMPDDEPSGPMTPSHPMPMDMPDDSTDGPTMPDKQQMMGRSLGLMEIRFSVFGTWYEIDSLWEGRFLESTRRGAFAKTIAERGDQSLPVLFNHGFDPTVGDKILGVTESLSEQADSPVAQVSLFDTSYNRDLYPGLAAGSYGSSFTFRVIKDEWNDAPDPSPANPKGLPERTITEVKLLEAGPVTWPANPAASAGLRCVSGTDIYYQSLRGRDPAMVDALRGRVDGMRTCPPVDDGRAATPSESEPVNSHSGDLARAVRLRRIREARIARLAALRRAS